MNKQDDSSGSLTKGYGNGKGAANTKQKITVSAAINSSAMLGSKVYEEQ
jgi:hypothetical protein